MDNAKAKNFPHEIRDVDAETTAELLKFYTGERTGFVQVGPEGYFFPYKYKKQAELYYNFEARPDDVWIITLPRSGTTWTQEMIWLLANDLNFDKAEKYPIGERFPYLESSVFIHDAVNEEYKNLNKDGSIDLGFIDNDCQPRIDFLNNIPRSQRRFINTHLPFSLMPKSILENNCKIIYVARNPKDVAVSYFHLHRLLRHMGYNGDFRSYWQHFQDGLSYCLPYNSHVNEAIAHRHLPNVLFLNYEDALRDLTGYLNKIGDFLDCKPRSEKLERLLDHLSIQNIRRNRSVNIDFIKGNGIFIEGQQSFVRRGIDSTNSKKDEQQEFLDNPDLLQSANDWVQQYNTNFRNL